MPFKLTNFPPNTAPKVLQWKEMMAQEVCFSCQTSPTDCHCAQSLAQEILEDILLD
jgi:hypothetical protein